LTLDNLGTDVELTVFHLQNIKPADAIANLKTLASRELRTVQIANSNTLILLDRASVMPQIKWIIQELDKPVADSRWRDFYVCKHISSSQVVSELKKILPILGFSVSGTSSA